MMQENCIGTSVEMISMEKRILLMNVSINVEVKAEPEIVPNSFRGGERSDKNVYVNGHGNENNNCDEHEHKHGHELGQVENPSWS